MHLLIPNLHYPVPIDPGPQQAPSGPLFDVRIPTNDPRALALTPGMEVTMVDDDGQEQLIVLGRGWSTQAKGSVMRIPYTQAVSVPTAH